MLRDPLFDQSQERCSYTMPKASGINTRRIEGVTINSKPKMYSDRSISLQWPNGDFFPNSLGIRLLPQSHGPKSAIPFGRQNPRLKTTRSTLSVQSSHSNRLVSSRINTHGNPMRPSTCSPSIRAKNQTYALTVMDLTEATDQILNCSKKSSLLQQNRSSCVPALRRSLQTLDKNVEHWMDGLLDIHQATVSLMSTRCFGSFKCTRPVQHEIDITETSVLKPNSQQNLTELQETDSMPGNQTDIVSMNREDSNQSNEVSETNSERSVENLELA